MSTENSQQAISKQHENTSSSVEPSESIAELNINQWRKMLAEFSLGLENGSVSPVAANAFANLMGKALSSYKLQMEYAKSLGRTVAIAALLPESKP